MAANKVDHGAPTGNAKWFASRCIVCGLEPGAPICRGCERDFFAPDVTRCLRCSLRLDATATPQCGACLRQPPHFDGTTALADYVAPVSGMVAALKFGARLDLADAFARMLAAREMTTPAADIVVAVPLSFERQSERGFNQSLEIARRYARLTGARFDHAVIRVRHTAPQLSLKRDARRRNVRGAFGVSREVGGASVIVVDDVMTTGSTLDEIALVLKSAGAVRVCNRVVARTP